MPEDIKGHGQFNRDGFAASSLEGMDLVFAKLPQYLQEFVRACVNADPKFILQFRDASESQPGSLGLEMGTLEVNLNILLEQNIKDFIDTEEMEAEEREFFRNHWREHIVNLAGICSLAKSKRAEASEAFRDFRKRIRDAKSKKLFSEPSEQGRVDSEKIKAVSKQVQLLLEMGEGLTLGQIFQSPEFILLKAMVDGLNTDEKEAVKNNPRLNSKSKNADLERAIKKLSINKPKIL